MVITNFVVQSCFSPLEMRTPKLVMCTCEVGKNENNLFYRPTFLLQHLSYVCNKMLIILLLIRIRISDIVKASVDYRSRFSLDESDVIFIVLLMLIDFSCCILRTSIVKCQIVFFKPI